MTNDHILQWNVRGITSAKPDLIALLEQFQPSVIAIQETFLGNDYKIKIPGYNGICKQGHYNNRFHGGVAIYTHSSCPTEPLAIQSNLQVIATRIQLQHSHFITIASLYIPGKHKITQQDINNLIAQLPHPFLVLGDFNGHSPLWGNTHTDARGKLIERVLQDPQVVCLNDGSATHESGTAIDLSLASNSLVADIQWTTLPSVYSSDHHPILLNINGNQRQHHPSNRFNYRKADWNMYTDDELWNNLVDVDHFQDSESLIQYFYRTIIAIADKHIPKYTPKPFYPRSFWNEDCKRMINERERLYKKFKRTNEIADKIHWKHQRALTKRYIKQCKQEELQNYLENMKHSVPMSQIYTKLRQMRGKPPRTISVLNENGNKITTPKAIANTLAQSLVKTSSYSDCSQKFLTIKHKSESENIDFSSNENEEYNLPFSLLELTSALSSSKNTSPGNDQIHYQMLKHLPDTAKEFLLKLYNRLWTDLYCPPQWNYAIVIPIPKPGKNHTDPTNYRPIALTSCLCKLFEKMINKRLIEFLENHKLLSRLQCGFRKNRSTIDHLIRLETYLKKAFSEKKVTVGVFFDLAKAYDTTWRHGIMKDMLSLGLRGSLPGYIQKFLLERRFRVSVNGELSNEFIQEAGVPQGSILSVTSFAIKINSLASIIPNNVHASLFVDDVQIAFSGSTMHEVTNKLQPVINKMYIWAENNGFKFSLSKTNCMTFHHKPDFPLIPNLKMNGNLLPVVKSVKFLGMHWDPQLSWKLHINKLIVSCNQSLNLLRTLSSAKWGADHHILLQTYRLIIKPKIDYGSTVYGSAAEATLKKIDTIHNEALRIATGAFKSSPAESLYILANEPSLKNKRTDLICRKYFQTKCFILNPVYNSIINPTLQRQFENTHPALNPFIQRTNKAIEKLNIPVQPVLPYRTPSIYSWQLRRPFTDTDLATPDVKDIRNFFPIFNEHIRSIYPTHAHIYTDGSKDDCGVGAAAVYGIVTRSVSLPKVASVYTAEMKAMLLACNIIRDDNRNRNTTQYLICSDSLSAIQGLSNIDPKNHLMYRLQLEFHMLIIMNCKITVLWIPGHRMIPGNDAADSAARAVTRQNPEFVTCPFTDWSPIIKEAIRKTWKTRWQETNQKLKEIKEEPNAWNKYTLSRKEGVIINRLRIGHTNLTHSYLMDDSTRLMPPTCTLCNNEDLTIKHIFIDCPAIALNRNILKENLNLENLTLKNILKDHNNLTSIFQFLKDIQIYEKI